MCVWVAAKGEGVCANYYRGVIVARDYSSRGGDGFAFVIQNQAPTALGHGGMELGYGGIQNSIAVEFDSW